jgi:DNA mismatch repair protein MutL
LCPSASCPPQLVSQIAAGEIVERPASVLKELLENSVGAGAMRIGIDMEQGGVKRLYLKDNGCGIRKDELALALSRYATSKIGTLDDLACLASLGFGGEALPSIASVSRLILISGAPDMPSGWRIEFDGGGQFKQVPPVAHPVGTSMDVLDLFFNVPARRKFLHTELSHAEILLCRIALSRFDVALELTRSGRMVHRLRGDAFLSARGAAY